MNELIRAQGCLVGLAVGDAVGTTLEFKPPGSFEPITDMVGGGPFQLRAGQWTDDTSMALCLGHSLVYRQGFHAEDQMNRYCNWWDHGYMSSTGHCFDIGNTVASALQKYRQDGNPFAGSVSPDSAGNGSLMRLAPIAIFYHGSEELLHYAGESSRTTHGAAECIDACRYFASLLSAAISGFSKNSLRELSYSASTDSVSKLVSGEYLTKSVAEIKGSGYVIQSLKAALWCFYHSESFSEAILMAANLGDDADTTAAICGQLAGAYYCLDGIPESWKSELYMFDDLLSLATKLFEK